MAAIGRRRGLITDINVTPLVDIMLVLLIIFMLTAHLIARQAIEVQLPWLQKVLGDFLLVPIVMGNQSYENSRALGVALALAALRQPPARGASVGRMAGRESGGGHAGVGGLLVRTGWHESSHYGERRAFL